MSVAHDVSLILATGTITGGGVLAYFGSAARRKPTGKPASKVAAMVEDARKPHGWQKTPGDIQPFRPTPYTEPSPALPAAAIIAEQAVNTILVEAYEADDAVETWTRSRDRFPIRADVVDTDPTDTGTFAVPGTESAELPKLAPVTDPTGVDDSTGTLPAYQSAKHARRVARRTAKAGAES